MRGQIGLEKIEAALRIVILGGVVRLRMRLSARIEVELNEVDPAPVPRVVKAVLGDGGNETLLLSQRVPLLQVRLKAEAEAKRR